jgi:methyl-accepting chemotaxis protein
MRLKIATKTVAGFLLMIVLMSVVAVLGLQGLSKVTADYTDIVNRTDIMLIQARRLDAAELAVSRATFGYLLTQNPQLKADYDAARQESADALTQLKSMMRAEEAKADIADAEAADAAFEAAVQPVFSMTTASKEQIDDLVASKLTPSRAKVTADLAKLTSSLESYNLETQKAAATQATQTREFSVAVAALAAVLGIVIAVVFARSISRPVVAVAGVARRLAEGDLTVEELKVSSRDEVAEMASSINLMVGTMRDVMQRISLGAQSVTAASEELTAAAEAAAQAAQGSAQAIAQVAAGASEQSEATASVDATVGQVQSAIGQVASGATQSAGEVQQAAELMSAMTRSLAEMVTAAADTAAGSQRAAATAQSGANVVERTLEEFEQIRTVAVQASDSVKRLEKLSGQIGAITEVISGIADQTNLLALNAAIEAARAGEHGRGFAVVADEVRKLAERSASSAREITSLIEDIQNGTAESVKAMDMGVQRVEQGTQLAVEAGQALKGLLTATQEAAQGMGQITEQAAEVKEGAAKVAQAFDGVAALTEENTAATEQMAAGAAEVTKAVDRIAHVSQENAAASEEVSASVEELTASSEEVASSAQSLAKTAQDLQEQVLRFKL